jgi:hypothetical protein
MLFQYMESQIKVFYKNIYDRDIEPAALNNWLMLHAELDNVLRRKGYDNADEVFARVLDEYAAKINRLKQAYTEQQSPTKEQMVMFVDELVEKEKIRFPSIRFMVISRARGVAARGGLVVGKMVMFAAFWAIVIIMLLVVIFQLAAPVNPRCGYTLPCGCMVGAPCRCASSKFYGGSVPCQCGGDPMHRPVHKSICASRLRNYSQCMSI